MSQSVDRLKELLFDNEAHALGELAKRIEGVADAGTRSREELSRRIDGVTETSTRARDDLAKDLAKRVDGVAETDAKAREDLKRKIEEVYARAGNTERMTASVSEVLSEALRRAEVSEHSQLSQTIAPLVVTTIKTELRNSQDEMVEALYPITGRLVKSYVASAMKDLTDQMNRRLEQNPVMLRLQSLTTGRSVGELALAGTQDFDVKELYLIRRGSGELVARWPDTPISGREQAMSGTLAAVNEFANEAFSAGQSSLRQIDLGDEEVYLRGSPIYLLAARCSGQAPKSIEQSIDDTFLSAVEMQHQIEAQPASAGDRTKAQAAALARAGDGLKLVVANQLEDLRRPAGKGALKAVAAMIILPFLGWIAWGWYTDYRIDQIHRIADAIVTADPAMVGYPAQVEVNENGNSLNVSGLTPSQQAKSRIISDLKRSLPGIDLTDSLGVVGGASIPVPDIKPEFARMREEIANASSEVSRAALLRAHTRAERRLKQAAADLDRAGASTLDKLQTDAIKRDIAETDAILSEMKTLAGLIGTQQNAAKDNKPAAAYQMLAARLQELGDDILRVAGGDTHTAAAQKTAAGTSNAQTLDVAVEQFAAESERVAALAATAAVARSMRLPAPMVVAAPPSPSVQPAQISPRDKLAGWARSHAIFFASSIDYRDSNSAQRYMGELAQLMKASPALIRIVGYTDEVGGQNKNLALAQDRAEKVRRELIGLGVQSSQIVTVGRASINDLSDVRGAASPNRRVEFEMGFDGEAQQ
jgi:outer membrane protein OmpA-like peptidoglycan-associated protein